VVPRRGGARDAFRLLDERDPCPHNGEWLPEGLCPRPGNLTGFTAAAAGASKRPTRKRVGRGGTQAFEVMQPLFEGQDKRNFFEYV
jgi:hypothetical protein